MNRLPGICGAAIVILQLLSCHSSGQGPETLQLPLTRLEDHPLQLDEPSGLSLAEGGRSLWVVGGQTRFIYRLGLDGTVRDSVHYAGRDPEGIAFDPSDSTLWLVEEREREIVHLDLTGRVLRRARLNLEGDDNSGLEGICIDDDGSLYVVNEKDPAALILLTGDLAIEQMWSLGFAGDISGLAWDRRRQAFWMVSDQDQALYLWSPATGLTGWSALQKKNVEGVAYDADTDRLYVARESKSRLYLYEPGHE